MFRRRLTPADRQPTGPTRALAAILFLTLLAGAWPSSALAQLPAVTLLSPPNGTLTTADSDPPLAIPIFHWAAIPQVTKYRIQFSQDAAFATIALEATTANSRYTPTSASDFADGVWYWRVRAEAPAPPGNYSSAWSFTKQWASAGSAPALSAPADGETLAFYDRPAFAWQAVTGAARYRFQVASSPDGFNAPLLNQVTLAPAYQPSAKLANGTYYWRIVPLDPADHAGTPSEVRQFIAAYDQVPSLLKPADGAEPTFTPTFRWTAVRGAQFYRLEYSTDPTFQSGVTRVDTRNTAYTPVNARPNDVNFYWRVRAHSGSSVSGWSNSGSPWRFVKRWYYRPVLLTPVNLAQHVSYPFFSWTPVPGANRYKLEVSCENTFPPPPSPCGFTRYAANTWQVYPEWRYWATDADGRWYWRVTPVDHRDNEGRPSDVASFVYDNVTWAAPLVHPPYYYGPDDPGLGYLSLLDPREERAVAIPAFAWQRVLTSTLLPSNLVPNDQVPAYRLQVDDDPSFLSPNWTWDTENLSAAPTATAPFAPTAGVDYYWRVRPLDGLGGAEIGAWSQRWRTRIDARLGLTPTTGSSPQLLRPATGYEAVETVPMLEWWPLQGSDSYDVQISADGDQFESYLVLTATAQFAAYTPAVRLGYGSYYWRVRGRSGGLPVGDWSTPWRFQVAAQSHWRANRNLGNLDNRRVIGRDPAGDMADPDYDLTSLSATQSAAAWIFGFDVVTDTASSLTCGLYLDLDHADGSGATADARGYAVETIAAHRPEYAIYLLQVNGVMSAANSFVYGWTGSGWGIPDTLEAVGGWLRQAPGYVEIQVPDTAIGMEEETGSAAVSLWSALGGGGHAQDTVPSDPHVAYPLPDPGAETTTLSRFSGVSNRLTLAMPPTNATGDPSVFRSVPPFFWHLPVDTPWWGFNFQAALDERFTTPVKGFEAYLNAFVPPIYTEFEDFIGDNAYFWRVRPGLTPSPPLRGAWSQAGRFERAGLTPEGLETSVTFATPTFSWQRMEGAGAYDLQVDDDPSFGSPAVSANGTGQNSYTPLSTLERGTYYWRVRANRYDGVTNDWTLTQTFTLDLPRPTGLNSDPPGVVKRAPTLCWSPVLTPTAEPVLAAWKYRVEVSKGPSFSTVYDAVETEQACWTPTKGYGDLADYHWHVAMRDGNGRLGSYSDPAVFAKQYPRTTLILPPSGSAMATTPVFQWTPVAGAASYRLEVSQYANFGTLYDSATTNNTAYAPVKAYAVPKVYYWRVAMIDKDGNYGPFNTAVTPVVRINLPLVTRNR